jgi:membrane protein YdbS with pleckstrin-like domain
MDQEEQGTDDPATAMSPLDPRQIWVLRITFGITLLAFVVASVAADQVLAGEFSTPFGLVPAVVLLLGIPALIVLPRRRYHSWAYAEREDELHIRHGVWIRTETVVPFGRVQHIDVAQGPVERRFGLARLILHTAGTRSAAIPLPGLVHAQAEAMRDRIRVKIRQDLA